MILTSSLARASVIPTTFSSMISVTGSKITTAMGAMYRRRFIEFSFPSEESKIPCSTDLSALAAVAEIHIINPNR
ncbi:hypothetical protein OIU79_004991 [Salix purpurea]|uniref:Uncharacterized protein n=1 Tax=Salix purpurea TaxID=77065 RepID=A0A9Q0UBE9_SALPP|nr:hypothetical protein OIU79_004991 [Salix purpurea]